MGLFLTVSSEGVSGDSLLCASLARFEPQRHKMNSDSQTRYLLAVCFQLKKLGQSIDRGLDGSCIKSCIP